MHGITIIATHLASTPTQAGGAASPSGPSSNGFQLALSAKAVSQPAAQGVSAGISSSLGSQTINTLLQTQDLNETKGHGGGGGGSHRGSVKMTQGAEAEEAGESEEAQLLRQRKKLLKTANLNGVKETAEIEDEDPLAAEVKSHDPNTLDHDNQATQKS